MSQPTILFRNVLEDYLESHGILYTGQVIRKIVPPYQLRVLIKALQSPEKAYMPIIERAFEGYGGRDKRNRLDRRGKSRRKIDKTK